MTAQRHRSTLLRLLFSAALLTALFVAQPAHDHSSLAAPDVCAPCSWSLHSPTVVAAPVTVAAAPVVVVTLARSDAVAPSSRPHTTARPRSPPLA